MLFRSVLLLLSLSAAVLADDGESDRSQPTEQQTEEFIGLLNALPAESIRSALNSQLAQYKEGVFDHDRKAIEKVHNEDPPLATRLLSAAALEALKVDLVKRQTPTNTSVIPSSPETTSSSSSPGSPGSSTSTDQPSTPPPSPSSTSTPPPPPSSTSDLPSVELPTTFSTTDSAGSSVAVTSSFFVTPTASVEVPVTTTDNQGNTFTSSTYRPGVVLTHTDSAGSQVVITSAIPTTRRTAVRTDSQGSTFVTDIIPGTPEMTSMVVYVTTLSDGQVSTITSFEIVGATPTGDGGDGGPDGTPTKPAPGVQTAAGSTVGYPWLAEAVALVACAAVFTYFL